MHSQFLSSLLSLLSESADELWDLETLAAKTGYSKYHLCRAFQAATSEPLQTYLRRLRLAKGAQSLMEGQRVLDVAIECGYQSQEAFHRAFYKMFGTTPKSIQKGNHHASLLIKRPWQESLMPPKPLPMREVELDELRLKGMGGSFSYDQISQIESLWQRFARLVQPSAGTYGVTMENPDQSNTFLYYASIHDDPHNTQQELQRITVPAQKYKVFRHEGAASSLINAFNYIWGVWLPEQSNLKVEGIDFEHYPANYDPNAVDGWVDIYIPFVQ